MSSSTFALGSRRVVLPDGERPAVVVVADGRIDAVVDPAAAPSGWEDLGDLVLLPGLVDSHVHINDPGRAHWEGFDTATRAAAVGGITTLVDMPLNCLPPTTTVEAFRQKLQATEGRLYVDVAFWGGAVPGSEEHLRGLYDAGVLGFKAFLCDSGVPEYAAFAPGTIADLLTRTAELGVPLIVHAEDPEVLELHPPSPDADPRAYRTWLDARPPDAEVAAIEGLIAAARTTGGQVHVLHLSAAEAVAALRSARTAGLPVTVETCPHYLTLAAEDVPDGGTDHKCAPPIRERANQERLWAALTDGVIDAIVSDHSPAPPDIKGLDDGDLLTAWGGIASLQLGFPLVWTAARDRGFDLTDVTRWLATGPARVAGMTRKGAITPGSDADLVVFDPDHPWTIDAQRLEHRHPITPYDGRRVSGAVRRTYLGGRCIVRDGKVQGPAAGTVRRRDDV